MAPDRGYEALESSSYLSGFHRSVLASDDVHAPGRDRTKSSGFEYPTPEGESFTIRGIAVGLVVGILICFSNTFFGLQTGWVSGMTMPASLVGFAFFRAAASHLNFPFSPVENVLVQTVAGAVGTMPLGSGFVGVVPALEYLLKPSENGPLKLSLGNLVLWSLGLSFFGVVFGVPLRKQVIIKEKLKFPSGTATALMIRVLHGEGKDDDAATREDRRSDRLGEDAEDEPVLQGVYARGAMNPDSPTSRALTRRDEQEQGLPAKTEDGSWRFRIRLLAFSFLVSGLYTLVTYFVPPIRHIPFLGSYLAHTWLWTFNLSPAYLAQGIIMGPATTLHMLFGAIVGWGILSPLAKTKGWAPGPVQDWEHGSKGWIVWVSLAIMLADSIVSLGWLAGRPLLGWLWGDAERRGRRAGRWRDLISSALAHRDGYTAAPIGNREESTVSTPRASAGLPPQEDRPTSEEAVPNHSRERVIDDKHRVPDSDAPPEQLVGMRTVVIGLVASLLFCVLTIRLVFGSLVPIYATLIAVLMALLLSVMGVRALGETDLNPVSGISKLTQLLFALVVPRRHPNAIIINLVAGAVSEAGALQAGDMLQDLKTGHLVHASPKAQFYGQLIGSLVGAVASALVYKLYTSVYAVPGELFQVPTAYVWIFTARLVTGHGLPPMAAQWALGAAVLFVATSILRTVGVDRSWQAFVPGGIAVAVGMYNTPSFTLARAVGGLISWYWLSHRKRPETSLIIFASGLILGEGVVSIVNLVLASVGVRPLMSS